MSQNVDPAPVKAKRPARAYHQEFGSTSSAGPGMMSSNAPPAPSGYGGVGVGATSPMPPRPQLGSPSLPQTGFPNPPTYQQNAPLRHPDRPAHLQNYEHRPMSALPPGPPLQPESAIAQPPHTAGQRLSGPRNRIDPNQIPSPVTVQEQDGLAYESEPFVTSSAIARLAGLSGLVPAQVPLSLTDYVAVDDGNCSPRFIRATTYSIPHSDELANAAQLPIGLMIQPFAELKYEEGGQVPLVDFSQGPEGPPRCQDCRGYINPWVQFIEGGQKFICNLCGKTTEVSSSYFCNLDMSGRRMDCHQRAELCRGSVDFIVNKDYWVQSDSSDINLKPRKPEPMIHLFAIDVSWSSGKSGMLNQVTKGIKDILYPSDDINEGDEERFRNTLVPGSRVGIITFDRTVHFYNLKAGLEQAQMMVVSDLDDMFVPLGSEAMLVDPIESRSIIEALLDLIPVMFGENQIIESALGGPVQAALMSLKRLGGQVNIFLTSLPTIGPGSLKQREDTKLYNTDKEKTLFLPADPWYRQVAEECSLAGIGINTFLFPSQYIDVASISVLSGITGGEVFFHPRFTPTRDGCKVLAELRRVLTRETAVSVTMRIRCSNGIRIAEHFGSFLQRNVTDLDFGNMDADKAIAAIIKHEGKLDEKYEAHFQCALLYTSANGERRVRCHNLALSVTSAMGNVFRSADMDATIAVVTKQYVAQVTQIPLRDVRATLTDTCVKILLAYRKNCASSTSPGQLILPESYKLFPLYALGLMKTKAMKGGNVSSDVRTHYMRYLKSLGVASTVLMLYPRMVPIHASEDDVGELKGNGRIKIATQMRASYLRMEPHGAYLLENGDVMLLWLGSSVSPKIIEDLYGVNSLEELDPQLSSLPIRENRLSNQVRRMIKYFETQRGGRRNLPILIARQNVDGSELEFANMLVEDQNNDAMSYVDYLCFVHKQIQMDLSGERKDESSGIDPSALWRGAW
ncbi:uncharacterized protein MELLADRAFT_50176 [Melampsora larici-populina 98AG31]|uniref:Uncharacterized protein n=1 Tax=Melampsora larici-populina (strain 98AG31 / pathotype 3-4-7) TaxID=747676 RepID=F4S294_MELLP|nr:uncharacterized protein MELLADRAFT_50176 [Melampsora larici-populina 98AG31]EGG01243.1 hypothetical protein MELLADRAFT_50176 [Melampsora larici-populina 98AG31]